MLKDRYRSRDQFSGPAVDPVVLRLFYDKREALLSCFRTNPQLVDDPFDHRTLPSTHPVLAVIDAADLGHFEDEAMRAFPAEGPHRYLASEEQAAAALVELALYLVFLLNIFEPNKSLLHNIYATNLQIDALGKQNNTPCVGPINKVVGKSLGYMPLLTIHAENLIELLKRDLELGQRRNPNRSGLPYEDDCEAALVAAGFDVRRTPRSGDFGADLIVGKDGLSYAVQCKDTVKPAGVKAVQEASAARAHYLTDFGAVCSSGGFTDAALELASSTKVIVCDLSQLVRRLEAA